MSAIRFAAIFLLPLASGSCGTYVPEIQEFPGDSVTGQQLVQMIVQNITCEVQDAVNDVYSKHTSTFLDTWGVQITLSLQVEEKAGVTPVVNWLPPSPASAIFNLAGGGTLSSDATRIDKLNSYFTVQELRKLGYCDPASRRSGQLLRAGLKNLHRTIGGVSA